MATRKINNKPASAYAEPHTMSGKKVKGYEVGGPSNVEQLKKTQLSVANNRSADYAPTKTDGIKVRGTGAATKGLMARGPMA